MPEEFQRKIKMINNFYTTYFQITFNNKIPLYDNFHSLIRTSKKFKKLFLTILDIPVKIPNDVIHKSMNDPRSKKKEKREREREILLKTHPKISKFPVISYLQRSSPLPSPYKPRVVSRLQAV